MSPLRKTPPLVNNVNNIIYDLPAPVNISYLWNFGSILGLCLSLQILTGVLLTMHYVPHTYMAFSALAHMTREVNMGWILKYSHMIGASIMFMSMYLHMARNIYFKSFKLHETWNIGVIIYILTMAIAFMGYLLPWGQMSFWGATVITNMFSAIPYIGTSIVMWLWGGFAVSSPTLTRFYTLHFLMPIILVVLVLLHLIMLHQSGSSNPLGYVINYNKIPFHPYFTMKDLWGFFMILMLLMSLSLLSPNTLNDPENFINANPLSTPTHIKPEWYFLWAYAILRSIPNKLGGVVIMFAAILILFMLPAAPQKKPLLISQQLKSWSLFNTFILLTWIGNNPVEDPYISTGAVLTLIYFMLILSELISPTSKPH